MTPTRRHSLLLISLLLLALTPARGEVIKENAGWYSVDIPLPFERDDQFTDSELGKLRLFTLSHDGGTVAYNVSYSDYPDGAFAGRDLSALINVLVRAQTQSMRATVRSTVPSQLGDIVGQETILDVPSQHAVFRLRNYIVGDRLFQVTYMGPAGSEAGPEALKFLNSFKLIHLPKAHPAQ